MRYLRFTPRLVSAVLVALVLRPQRSRPQPPEGGRTRTDRGVQAVDRGRADKINPMHEITPR